MKRIVGAFIVAVCVTLGSAGADASFPCNTWVTVSTTPKTYGSCSQTTIGPWTSPVGGCLQWVSWKRTQWRINYNGSNIRQERTLRENEVRQVWQVSMGPVQVTKTATVPGSHTTTTISSYNRIGTWHCGIANASGSW